MKSVYIILAVLAVAYFVASNGNSGYKSIPQDQAKQMMDSGNVIVLDVREQSEFDAGHIKDAVLLPVGTINEKSAAAVIPSKDSTVLVYCRSGNRSKTASEELVKLGYKNIYEIGGINSWKYGVEY